jgi:hypothetical protein
MSSWIIAKSRPNKVTPSVSKYHDTLMPKDIYSLYTEFIASFIYFQKMGETCAIWDSSDILKETLRNNPQVKFLKERPAVDPISLQAYYEFTSKMKFADIQKVAANLIVYDQALNNSVVKHVESIGIKTLFDIGIKLNKDEAGPNISLMKQYASLIKTYQTKMKKDKLNIYIMSDNYSIVSQFQIYGDPSWKITSLSKNIPKDVETGFIQSLAEIQIMTSLPSLILDFNYPSDRFIYLMKRNQKLDYFVELNNTEWKLQSI